MSRKDRFSALYIISVCLLILSFEQTSGRAENVQIVDKGNYCLVTINAQSATSSAIGSELGSKIPTAVPDYEWLLDSYIVEGAEEEWIYDELMLRVNDIRSQVPSAYQDEINAMSAAMNLGTTNGFGDGQLSRDELWLYNLIPDVAREYQCSALGVYNNRSASGRTIAARLLDWDVGTNNQLAKLQAVYRFNNGSKTITTIGFLGFQAILSGYNDDNVFVSILDSETGSPYASTNRRSYGFDLRYALENENNLGSIAAYMSDPLKNYAFNHLIFMADAVSAVVLENNFSGTGSNMRRALRYADSVLNSGIEWGFTDAVASVNAFMLLGNHDNFTGELWNTARWGSFRSQLASKGATVTWEELKEIATYEGGNGPGSNTTGDIYTDGNIQIILFEPASGKLEVAFHPKTGAVQSNPVFDVVFADNPVLPWIPLLLMDQ